jgi:hypothetical protein
LETFLGLANQQETTIFESSCQDYITHFNSFICLVCDSNSYISKGICAYEPARSNAPSSSNSKNCVSAFDRRCYACENGLTMF